MKKLITVFGPSDCTAQSALYQSAERLGTLLAEAGFGVVTGGYEGVMEAVSKGARSAGAGVIGITAEVYYNRGREANEFVTKQINVKSAVDRLMELLDLADAFVACGI
ncbi:MAG: LOG family protein, partial [Bacteroidota bacterium]|nr:LOG family protein [Bacteroidota bacterium]